MYAVIETGGKQYKVEQGDVLKVEKLQAEAGDQVSFDKVLMIAGDDLQVGKPYLEGASVKASVKKQAKDKKVVIGKFRAKKGYRRRQGHRQPFTLIVIDEILG